MADMRETLRNEILSLLTESVILSLDPFPSSLSPAMNPDWLRGKRVCIADPRRGLFSIQWDELAHFSGPDPNAVFQQAEPINRIGDLDLRTVTHLHRQLAEKEYVRLREVIGGR